ncbi:MAG: nicotinate-nucleotide adenylyltransferase [Flavobacteriaceae bacterium CG2_30_34_30]|nr:TonB-dependent receptor [Flavobacteriia bacterium]OIP48952.1 MAG: nicotinate-nucleotide adenylyltransferase [Flavobacteriaceae bacterium CG2_30_34_30]PIQ18456.1 MAG: nicotinate-nucleotide adenylyltransferase [Flavobacteriaceae bacterium CG18_big_fil_WC_8_21_14_2_50_34_36]PIV49775.1 MAG: nicotinate-nucleotide adenylyltransferase [Flavobacteriaceae bacterium CG02_land_8_20_14_3_00_34_13]PIZ07916.1 MAG: nicotinate-nucleotide adenylyltransferase [Flavobacteriaceae bacterium CG_4_10_14_0_8_um_fil
MPETIKGDKEFEQIPSIKSKSLRINLNENIYGTFAEIGAGQETVRNFFRAGGASGTIAKAMSAYDKDFSDAIYGVEDDGRYVTEARLKKMLFHEMQLMEDRISREKHPSKLFFAYANTVATIDFAKKFKGHGWVGIKFQMDPNEDYNEIILHARFLENDAKLQQITLGTLGVNLIYGAYYKHDEPRKLLRYLYDHIDKDQIEIDMINFSGPRFEKVDNRLMSLQLIKNGMTEAVMFGPDGNNMLPAAVLYKKNILALRGSFRPVTKVNIDMYERSYDIFVHENKVDKENTICLFEITLSNLRAEGEIDEEDFMDRARLLCSLGHTVLISNFQEYYKLVEYFSRYTKARMGLTMGVNNLIDIFDEKYYRHLSGGILEAFGKLFFKDLKVYLYPMQDVVTNEITTSENLKVHPRMKELYKFFKYNGKVVDIEDYNPDILNIFSREVLQMISDGNDGWEVMLPPGVSKIIKEKNLFGHQAIRQEATKQ